MEQKWKKVFKLPFNIFSNILEMNILKCISYLILQSHYIKYAQQLSYFLYCTSVMSIEITEPILIKNIYLYMCSKTLLLRFPSLNVPFHKINVLLLLEFYYINTLYNAKLEASQIYEELKAFLFLPKNMQ